MTISSASTEDAVRQVIERQLNLAAHGRQLGPDDSLWDMGMTSLTCLGLMLSLEDTFDVELPEEMLKESTFRSLTSIMDAIESARSQKRDSPASDALSAR